jgi:hypothetical protein
MEVAGLPFFITSLSHPHMLQALRKVHEILKKGRSPIVIMFAYSNPIDLVKGFWMTITHRLPVLSAFA